MWRNKNSYPSRNQQTQRGYTILEVMIFLAVSTALAVSAFNLIGGQQAKTEFAQAVRDFDLRLQDIINDVSTGYYASSGNFTCRAGATPIIESGSSSQGSNPGCVILGQVIEFGSASGNELRIFNVVGLRQTNGSNPKEVKDLDEAKPTPIAPAAIGDPVPDGIFKEKLQSGLRVSSVRYGGTDIGAIGILTNFAQSGVGGLESGSRNADLYPIIGTTLGSAGTFTTAIQIKALNNASVKNPSSSIEICMVSTSRLNQAAVITLGSNGRQLSTKTIIRSGGCP
jgi:type II secretory pathway pseudopilin PulG